MLIDGRGDNWLSRNGLCRIEFGGIEGVALVVCPAGLELGSTMLRRWLSITVLVVSICLCGEPTRAGVAERVGFCLSNLTLGQFGRSPRSGGLERNRSPDGEQLAVPEGTVEPKEVQQFWKLHDQVRQTLAQRGLAAPMMAGRDGDIAWTIDRAAVASYDFNNASRYFALRLAVGNRSSQVVAISRASVVAEIDGEKYPLKPIEGRLVNHGFTTGDVYHPLASCQPFEELKIPSKGVANAWMIFPDLAPGTTVPPVKLQFQLKDAVVALDVREHQRAVLDLNVERLGPRQGLAVLTIGGVINSLNAQSIVDELEALVTQQIVRAVIRWKPSA
ncbi:MAG: hypothetical protein B7Z55_17955, partial [Planctomycetales bacterium 12-60-4]